MQVSKVHQNLIRVTAKAQKYSILVWLCLRAVAEFKPSGKVVSSVEGARELFLATGTNVETWFAEFNAFRISHGFISGGFLVWQQGEAVFTG